MNLRFASRPLSPALLLAASAATVLCGFVPTARAEGAPNACGPIYGGGYGPYDYRTQRDKLVVVDKFHFAPEVEALLRGQSTYLGGDLSYVLRASPNHHRALVAVTRFAEKMKSPQPFPLEYPVECYFDRAIRFAADDIVVHVLYAQFLGKHGRKPEAVQQLETATLLAKDEAFSHYNIGLMYLEIGDYDHALAEAWRAQALGFERTDLIGMLKRQNKWREPPPEAAGASAPEASGAASAAASAAD